MNGPVLRLNADDVRRALDDIDPAELWQARTTGPATEHDGCRTRRVRPPREPATTGDDAPDDELDDELVLFEQQGVVVRTELPRSVLCLGSTAMMVALAAGELLARGETTVALLASGDTALFHLETLLRHLPGIGQICLTSAGREAPPRLDVRVLDLLRRAGIELSVVDTLDEAALGANLVISTGPGHGDLTHRHFARGVLLVNATGRDLPADVVNHVDQIYVDDLSRLEHFAHRHFVSVHLRSGAPDASTPLRQTDGWHHQWATWYQVGRVEGDLGQVIARQHPGRAHIDDILLFEPLATRDLEFALLSRIHQIALLRGLGTWKR